MSADAIRQIKEVEEQADILCRVAREKADEMRERVREEGETHCKRVENEVRASFAAALSDMRHRAALLEQKKKLEAEARAEALAAAAREKIPEAVKMIVWEIVEKCQ